MSMNASFFARGCIIHALMDWKDEQKALSQRYARGQVLPNGLLLQLVCFCLNAQD